MQTNKTVISWTLTGLATGAVAWYFLGTNNGKQIWNRLAGFIRNKGEMAENDSKSHYNDRSYQQKHNIGQLETAVL